VIRVVKFKVRTINKTYVQGDVITELSEEDEKKLVDSGFAEYLEVIKELTEPEGNEETKTEEGSKDKVETTEPEEPTEPTEPEGNEETLDSIKIDFDPNEYVKETKKSRK